MSKCTDTLKVFFKPGLCHNLINLLNKISGAKQITKNLFSYKFDFIIF